MGLMQPIVLFHFGRRRFLGPAQCLSHTWLLTWLTYILFSLAGWGVHALLALLGLIANFHVSLPANSGLPSIVHRRQHRSWHCHPVIFVKPTVV